MGYDRYAQVILSIIGLLIIFLTTSLALIIRQLLHNLYSSIQKKHLEEDEQQIIELIYGDRKFEDFHVHINSELAKLMVHIAENFIGEEKEKIAYLYEMLGLLEKDIKLLRFGTARKKIEALSRCRALEIDLPDIAWKYLLNNSDLNYRWSAMEYLIKTKKMKSVFWVISFLTSEKNRNIGVIQHLLSSLASIYAEAIPHILTYTDDELIREQCLRTLSVYPVASSENLIIEELQRTTSPETRIAATKALGAAPTSRTLIILKKLSNDENWVVRLEIARSLINFEEPTAIELLEHLLEDENYYVRLRATKTLIDWGETASALVEKIKTNALHPSHKIYTYIDELKGAA